MERREHPTKQPDLNAWQRFMHLIAADGGAA